jgi:hypothetical protein
MEQQIVGLINNALNCMSRGIDGHQFADAVITMNTDLEYDRLVSQIQSVTVPVLIQLCKGIPQIGPHVTAYEEQFARFLSEFVEGPYEYGDSGEPEDESAKSGPSKHKKAAVVA